jgi:CHASE3 domain sensor protein
MSPDLTQSEVNAQDINDVEDELSRNRRMILRTRQMIRRQMWAMIGGMGTIILLLVRMVAM